MRLPITEEQAKSIRVWVSSILAIGAIILGFSGFVTLLVESARYGRERAYQNGLNNGMIECQLRPDECDARFEAWEAKERLKRILDGEGE